MTTAAMHRHHLLVISFVVMFGVFVLFNPLVPEVDQVSVEEAKALIDAGAVVIDVRDHAASLTSHIPGAHLYPIHVLGSKLVDIEAWKAKRIIVYCNEGTKRGLQATEMLNSAGYTQAVNLKSGIEGWRAANLPTANR